MKKKYIIILITTLITCSVSVVIKAEEQEQVYDTDCGYEEFEWEEDDALFLDDVAGRVEDTEKEHHELSVLDKAFIGAKAAWHFCILLPYQKVKYAYFDYVHPFVISPWKDDAKESA